MSDSEGILTFCRIMALALMDCDISSGEHLCARKPVYHNGHRGSLYCRLRAASLLLENPRVSTQTGYPLLICVFPLPNFELKRGWSQSSCIVHVIPFHLSLDLERKASTITERLCRYHGTVRSFPIDTGHYWT